MCCVSRDRKLSTMGDTTKAAERARLTAIRAIAPAQRLRTMFDHSEFVRRLAMAGVRTRNAVAVDVERESRMSQERLDTAGSQRAAP